MFNLPEGNNDFLNDDNMICQHCDRKDDVDNGEYHNHMWYCDDCFKELFKVCPKCNVCVISVDEEMCEDCLAEKTYDESAEGMFEKLGYKKIFENEYRLTFCKEDGYGSVYGIYFNKYTKNFSMSRTTNNITTYAPIYIEDYQAITQQMKELGWL